MHEIEPLALDWDMQAQIANITDKVNELVEAHNKIVADSIE